MTANGRLSPTRLGYVIRVRIPRRDARKGEELRADGGKIVASEEGNRDAANTRRRAVALVASSRRRGSTVQGT